MLALHSKIRPELLRATLFRGMVFAGAGVFLFLAAGTRFPIALLQRVGLPVALIGFFLILVGMIPYKRLNRLETKPHRISCIDGEMIFSKESKPLFKLPLQTIQEVSYLEKGTLYGLGINLKTPLPKALTVLQNKKSFATFFARTLQKFENTDLFLPYFMEKDKREIERLLDGSSQEPEEDHAS